MDKKVITFGEIMLRLATPDYLRFCQSDKLNATLVAVKLMLPYHWQTMVLQPSL